ncbi:hypothetical protein [Rhizobium tibeticum]|uniref:hypothetical protein n=1 Tax=Rhizobium tibeticum TaxID=501024 RepID=UPI001FCD8961|nr:hypothetical protein [Rhizobium tibeticum]
MTTTSMPLLSTKFSIPDSLRGALKAAASQVIRALDATMLRKNARVRVSALTVRHFADIQEVIGFERRGVDNHAKTTIATVPAKA